MLTLFKEFYFSKNSSGHTLIVAAFHKASKPNKKYFFSETLQPKILAEEHASYLLKDEVNKCQNSDNKVSLRKLQEVIIYCSMRQKRALLYTKHNKSILLPWCNKCSCELTLQLLTLFSKTPLFIPCIILPCNKPLLTLGQIVCITPWWALPRRKRGMLRAPG